MAITSMQILLTYKPCLACCLYAVLSCFCTFSFLDAQVSPGFRFTRYGIEDGLDNITLHVLGQDSTGYLWLSDPLTRFDGYTFKTYWLDPANESAGRINACSMTDDGKGNLFFASPQGVFYYDQALDYVVSIPSKPLNNNSRRIYIGKTNEFWDVNMSTVTKIVLPGFDTTSYSLDTRNNMRMLKAVPGQEDLWSIQPNSQLKRYQLGTDILTSYTLGSENISFSSRFVSDLEGRLWYCGGNGLWHFDTSLDSFLLVYPMHEVSFPDMPGAVPNFYIPGKDCWWIYKATSNTVFRLDLATQQVRSFFIQDHFTVNGHQVLYSTAMEMPDGSLIMGSSNGGLFHIQPASGQITRYQADVRNPTTLFSDYCEPEFITGSNTVWLCGLGQGLVKAELATAAFPRHVPIGSSNSPGMESNVRALIEWNDQLIVGSIGSISLFNKEHQFTPLPLPHKKDGFNSRVAAAAIAKDPCQNLLIQYWQPDERSALYYHDYRRDTMIRVSRYFPYVSFEATQSLFCDSRGYFWIAAQRGVIRLASSLLAEGLFTGEPDQFRFFSFADFHTTPVDVHSTFAITEDQHHGMWIGTNTGLFYIDDQSEEIRHFEPISGDKRTLSHNSVRAVVEGHDHRIWVGTAGGGLNLYLPETGTFQRYSIEEGLPDNVIYTIAEDDSGNLWMGTNKGLCRFDPVTLHVRTFTPSDGIQSYEFNTNAVCKTSDGHLAFGGIEGFNLFDPDSVTANSVAPQVVISSMEIHGKPYPFATDVIYLDFDKNFLSFDFAALDYFRNEKNQYAYKMVGVDTGWVYSGNRHFATYPGLAPGKYTFQVKAANSEGVWNREGISKVIIIAPPWWKTLWFRLIILSSIAYFIYAFYRYRLRQALKLQHIRNRIAADLHDDIGSTLSSITLAGSVIRHKLDGSSSEVNSLLTQISTNTDNMMEAMSDIVWAVNTKNDRFEKVVNRMRAFAIELLEPNSIQFHLSVDPHILEVKLDMEQRKNIYLIFKEAIHNASKYAACKNLWVDLRYTKGRMMMDIRDDGIGFNQKQNVQHDPALSHRQQDPHMFGGNGLYNMEKRARELKGEITITSAERQGTRIHMSFEV